MFTRLPGGPRGKVIRFWKRVTRGLLAMGRHCKALRFWARMVRGILAAWRDDVALVALVEVFWVQRRS